MIEKTNQEKEKTKEKKFDPLKINIMDEVFRAIPKSLMHMAEETLFVFTPSEKHAGNVVPIINLVENVAKQLEKQGIEFSSEVHAEIARVLNNSIQKGSSELVVAKERMQGLPLLVIRPDKTLVNYDENFPRK